MTHPPAGAPPPRRAPGAQTPCRKPHRRAGAGRPPRARAAAAAGRPGRRQDQDAHPPRRPAARHRARAAVGDPRRHLQRPRRRRAQAAARRPARRTAGARRHRRHLPLGLRAAAQRARHRVRAHRRIHGLRPGRRAQGHRVAALRRPARTHPTGAGRPRTARQQRGLDEISLAKNRLLDPDGYEHTARHPAASADRRRVARGRHRAAALQRVRLRRPARPRGPAAGRAPAPPGVLPPALEVAARRRIPGHQRGPERPCRFAGRRRRQRHLVADDDQAIYRFRGAEPRNVLGFGERYPGHAQIVLGRNFRCRAEILAAPPSAAWNTTRGAPARP